VSEKYLQVTAIMETTGLNMAFEVKCLIIPRPKHHAMKTNMPFTTYLKNHREYDQNIQILYKTLLHVNIAVVRNFDVISHKFNVMKTVLMVIINVPVVA
jgi:hypothetical protein